jgi:hypothetical protein
LQIYHLATLICTYVNVSRKESQAAVQNQNNDSQRFDAADF